MRKVAVGRWLFLGTAFAGLFVWGACGDDDASGPTVADAGRDVALDTTARDAKIDQGFDAAYPYDSGIVAPPPLDAGPENAITFDGGDVTIPCVAGGTLEAESNDTKATANPLSGSRCGVVRIVATTPDAGGPVDAGPPDADAGDPGDAGDAIDAGDAGVPVDAGPPDAAGPAPVLASESDFLTFKISATATRFYIQFSGDVQVLVYIGDAAPQDITGPNPPVVPFRRDDPYYIEVRSPDGKPHTWRVTLFEE